MDEEEVQARIVALLRLFTTQAERERVLRAAAAELGLSLDPPSTFSVGE